MRSASYRPRNAAMSISTNALYDVELLDSLQTGSHPYARRLPGRVSPLPNEAFSSWLLRYADPFGIPPSQLLFGGDYSKLTSGTRWWRRPNSQQIAVLAERTGVTAREIG